jgi:hypothetical protein
MVRDLKIVQQQISQMDNTELFQYLHETEGHYSDYSSLYIYLAKHSSMEYYYRRLFENRNFKTFLDLGPGVGASLDVAKELGAKTYFIDRDIFIHRYCTNKGHNGTVVDFFNERPRIRRYDLVLSRGSFNVDMMNETNFPIYELIKWLIDIGKQIIVIPTWNKGEIVNGQDYTCVGDHLDNYMKSKVHGCFINYDFKMKFIDGINDRLRFPITYEYI